MCMIERMDLEVRHLRLVAAIADTGTVTKAGATLHLSQSAVSHALCTLEERLGTPLFLRVGRRMLPTEAGRQLVGTATQILRQLEQAEAAARGAGAGRTGTLRLSTQCYTCYHWLPPLLSRFRRAHPGIQVEIKADVAADPIAALLDGRLDVAMAMGPIKTDHVVAQHVFDETMVAVMAPGHRLARRPHVGPDDLEQEIVLLHSRPEESVVFQRVFAPAGVNRSVVQTVALTEAIVEIAKAGMGVGLLADWAAAPYLRTGELHGVPLTRRGVTRPWYAVTLKASAGLPHVKSFVDLLVQHPPSAKTAAPRRRAGGASRADFAHS